MKFFFCFLLLLQNAFAYVPTVESLFRRGNNPDITTNAVLLAGKVMLVNPYAEKKEQMEGQPMWVKWVYNITPQGKLKLTQLIYKAASMTEASLVDKTFIADLTPRSFSDSPEGNERGLFLALLNSLLINDGSFMVDYLRSRGATVRLNADIINRDKRALLARYRAWLMRTKGGRAGGGEESPINPSQNAEAVEQLMNQPMYEDTKHVTLARYQGEPAWVVKSEGFEAWVGDTNREVKQLIQKSAASDTDIQCKDYILFNGTQSFPRQILVKSQQDQFWQIDFMTIRPFNESGAELLSRLRRHDQILQQKREALSRPAFLF